MTPSKCIEVSPQCPKGQEDGYKLGWHQGQVALCDDYHGTPCEQIRHQQYVDRLLGLISDALEDATEFETEWDKEARQILAESQTKPQTL